jgi:hypothetical protein
VNGFGSSLGGAAPLAPLGPLGLLGVLAPFAPFAPLRALFPEAVPVDEAWLPPLALLEPVAVPELLGKPGRPSWGVVVFASGEAIGAAALPALFALLPLPVLLPARRFPPPIWPTPGTPGMLPSPFPGGVPLGVP